MGRDTVTAPAPATPDPAVEALAKALAHEFHDDWNTGHSTAREAEVRRDLSECFECKRIASLLTDLLAQRVAQGQREAWEQGVSAGRRTDIAAETQPTNPYAASEEA